MTEEQEREIIMGNIKGHIFVFGSNLLGVHGAGAAAYAFRFRGAKMGVGVGLTGSSYAIPTKGYKIETLPLNEIALYVKGFVGFAQAHPEMTFVVTRVGCGLAGYEDKDIAPMFRGAPGNCILPLTWQELLT